MPQAQALLDILRVHAEGGEPARVRVAQDIERLVGDAVRLHPLSRHTTAAPISHPPVGGRDGTLICAFSATAAEPSPEGTGLRQ